MRLHRYCYSYHLIGFLLGLALTLSASTFADSHIYQFSYPKMTKPSVERARVHQWTSMGTAQFQDSIKIPAYGVSIVDPMDDGLLNDFKPCQPKSCGFNFKLKPALAQQLVALNIAGLGWFLAPKNWRMLEADMGANGSSRLVMLSPDNTQYLTFSDTSACVGCSLTEASLFFKEARQEAINNEFWAYTGSNVPLKQINLNPQTVLYSYQLPHHYSSDGVAKFTGIQADIVNFRQMTVSLKPEDKPLAQVILNFYQAVH